MEKSMAVDLPGKAAFAAQVHSTFDVDVGDGDGTRFSLELVALDDGRSTAQHEQFSLVFHAPAQMPAHQGTYHLENHELGAMDLFLVPVAHDADTLVLEAVFNRLLDSEKE
jgi:hypothetical protein